MARDNDAFIRHCMEIGSAMSDAKGRILLPVIGTSGLRYRYCFHVMSNKTMPSHYKVSGAYVAGHQDWADSLTNLDATLPSYKPHRQNHSKSNLQ